LAKYEDQILDAIARTPHGALLFLSDPGRFLTEAGFVGGQGLQAELNDLPGLKENSPGRYEDIRAGKGRAATWRVQIRSLGLRSDKLDKLDRRSPRRTLTPVATTRCLEVSDDVLSAIVGAAGGARNFSARCSSPVRRVWCIC
jgi:hypothetical protein